MGKLVQGCKARSVETIVPWDGKKLFGKDFE
jgi:hypothetical protein